MMFASWFSLFVERFDPFSARGLVKIAAMLSAGVSTQTESMLAARVLAEVVAEVATMRATQFEAVLAVDVAARAGWVAAKVYR